MESDLVAKRLIQGAGTTEAEWWSHLARLPFEKASSLLAPARRLVVCAPHPDDEILPCAGLLVAAHGAGIPIVIVAVTDGEVSHGSGGGRVEELRRCRPLETALALGRLAVEARTERLRIPDGKVADCESRLTTELKLRSTDVVITPWRLDGHPDHEATTRAVFAASSAVGCAVLEVPIWGWHWARPEDGDMPWEKAVCVQLSAEMLTRKSDAIRAFKSQIAADGVTPPVLTAATRERFERDFEVYFR